MQPFLEDPWVFGVAVLLLSWIGVLYVHWWLLAGGRSGLIEIAFILGGSFLGLVLAFVWGSVVKSWHIPPGMSVPSFWGFLYLLPGVFGGGFGALIGVAHAAERTRRVMRDA